MPSRNGPSDAMMSVAVRAASPGVTSPSTATNLPKPARTAMSRIPTPCSDAGVTNRPVGLPHEQGRWRRIPRVVRRR